MKGQRLIWITLTISAAVCFFIYQAYGVTEEIIRLNIRITARISYLLFSAAFIASSLIALKKSEFTRFLLQNRRYIGLSFGVSHIIHMINILILLFVIFDGDINGLGGLKKLTPAIIVYVYIFLMMATSNDYSVKLLGGNAWTRVHRLGMYSIASALGVGFYKVINNDPLLYGFLLALLIVQVTLRIYVRMLKSRSKLLLQDTRKHGW